MLQQFVSQSLRLFFARVFTIVTSQIKGVFGKRRNVRWNLEAMFLNPNRAINWLTESLI